MVNETLEQNVSIDVPIVEQNITNDIPIIISDTPIVEEATKPVKKYIDINNTNVDYVNIKNTFNIRSQRIFFVNFLRRIYNIY